MGLPWIRFDTSVPDNPKILGLLTENNGHRAAWLWVCSMAYAGKHGTDGFIIREALPVIHGRAADAKTLVAHGFWTESAGGWAINGWDEFQLTSDEQRERRERAQRAAAVRWSKSESKKKGA